MFRGRTAIYIGLVLGLGAARYFLGGIPWTSTLELHTLMEFAATLLAVFIAGPTLARYYATKNRMYLLIGCGFLGTGLLDGYHTLVTSQWFSQYLSLHPSSLITWSWNATRIYLGTFLFLSYWTQRKEKPPGKTVLGDKYSILSALVFLVLAFIAYFFLAGLSQVYYPEYLISRPGELVAGSLFLLALIGYLRKGRWRRGIFEHWLVIALILSLAGQTLFMSCSSHLCDLMFDVAHLAKITSYWCVFTGLLLDMYNIFFRAEKGKNELANINIALKREIEQRKWVQEEVRLLNVGLEKGVSQRTAQLNSALLDLQVQKTRLRTILETAGEGIISFNQFTNIESLNPAALKIFGYEEQEVIGKSIALLVEKSHRSHYYKHLRNFLDKGVKTLSGKPREILGLRKDGSTFPIEVTVDASSMGEDYLFIGTVQDIAERKKAESSLKETRNRLELALRGSNLGLWDVNLKTKEATYDERWASMLGYKLEEIEQTADFFDSLCHPEETQKSMKAWLQHKRRQKPFYSAELRLRTKNGRWKWILTHGQLVDFDEEGKPLRAVGIHQDITKQKETEAALRETRDRLELALKGSNLGLWDRNLVTDEVHYDERYANMLGYELSEFEQSQIQFNSLIHPGDFAELKEAWLKGKQGKTPFYTAEFRMKAKNGNWKWIYTQGQFFDFDDDGQPRRAIGIHQDITERKQTEEVLRQSEERYRSLFENSPIPHWEQDYSAVKDFIDRLHLNGVKDFRKYFREHPKAVVLCGSLIKILNVNQATLKLFKGNDKNDLQDGLNKMATSESFAVVRKVLIDLCEGQSRFESQFKGKDLEGNPYHVILNLFLIPGFEDDWSRVLISTVDILKLREAEEQAARLGHILEESLNEIYIFEPQTLKFIQVNRGARENLQYSSEELAKLTPLDFKPDFTSDTLEELMRPLLSGEKEVLNFSTSHRRKDGTIYPVEYHLQMSTFKNTSVVVAITEDVTERDKAEQTLRENEARLSTILNTVADGIVVFDQNKRIHTFNPAAEKMFGYSFEEISQLNVTILLKEEYIKQYEGSLRQYLATGVKQFADIPQEVEGVRKDGSIFPMEFIASVAETGEGPKWIVLIRDITERKKLQQELENHRQNLEYTVESRTAELRQSMEKLMDSNLRLQEANSHRNRFISSMSHELRTPLSAILGFSDLYKKNYSPASDEKQNAYIENITNAGRHLLYLINGLLDLAKIDSGKMEIDLEAFQPEDFFNGILNIMSAQFKEKNLEVQSFIDPSLTRVNADRKKCMQIMFNLLSNAIKYTPPHGRIDIHVVQNLENEIRVEVCDTGEGIDPREQDKIFSEFYRVGKTGESTMEGTGIGLALTRRLVELHGGKIGVQSQLNVGSTFWFTLPQFYISDQLPEEIVSGENDEEPILIGRRIMLVEDNEIIRTMLLDMLNQQEHHITVAHNGKEAVELAEKFRPELIFMDMRMPVMDGLEATRRIRAIPEIANIPIIGLTASTGDESEERQAEAGCTDHLAKPVMAEEIYEMLKRHLGGPNKNGDK